MFMATLARYAQQILDLDALELLPEPGSGRPPALRPEPERRGPPRARARSSCGTRAGTSTPSPTTARRRVHAPRAVPEPRRLVDHRVRVRTGPPDGRDRRLRGAAARAAMSSRSSAERSARRAHLRVAPLERFRVRLRRRAASAHGDASALLRGEAGRAGRRSPSTSSWETHGEPYAYRVATRYEIPCRVSGTRARRRRDDRAARRRPA